MEKMVGIYKITSPVGRIYIGQSTDIYKRWKFYKYLSCNKSQRRLNRSFYKYGIAEHKFEILEVCESVKLDELEKHYIDLYQSFGTNHGLNLRDGGRNKGALSEETKEKISVANMGKLRSDEVKRKLSIVHTGRKGTNGFKNKNHTNETKLKMSLWQKGMSKGKVILNTETGIYYNVIQEASETIGVKRTTLKAQLSGQNKNKTSFIYA